jgi:hypothetical protein
MYTGRLDETWQITRQFGHSEAQFARKNLPDGENRSRVAQVC